MNDKFYKQAFDGAIKELSDLMNEREELDNRREILNERIVQVRNGVLGLSSLAGENPQDIEKQYPELFPDLIPSDIGLTDAVRKSLQKFPDRFLTPMTVRKVLQATGYDTDRYKNILASIHTVLKRLVESEEVETKTYESGGTSYKWIKVPFPKVGNSPDPKPSSDLPSIFPVYTPKGKGDKE